MTSGDQDRFESRASEKTRRDVVVAAIVTMFVSASNDWRTRLKFDPRIGIADGGLYRPPEPKAISSDDLMSLGRAFLFGDHKDVSGIAAKRNPFAPSGTISLPSRDALNSIIENLGIGQQIYESDIESTWEPYGTPIFTGGPVPNIYTRVVLGLGGQSPLFRISNQSRDDLPPVRFELPAARSSGKVLSYSVGTGHRPDWGLIVDGRLIEDPPEVLLVTSIPDPYRPAQRLIFVAGRHGAGARAINLLLKDAFLLERILKHTSRFVGWQVLIEVRNEGEYPVALGEMRIFEISADFDKLQRLLEGKPFFSDPSAPELSGFMGLSKLVDIDSLGVAGVSFRKDLGLLSYSAFSGAAARTRGGSVSIESCAPVAGEALKPSPALGAQASPPTSEEENMIPSYPPFSSVSELDDQSDLAFLPSEDAAHANELRQMYKVAVEKLRRVYEPKRQELERAHWGEFVIFHLISGRFVTGNDLRELQQRFRKEISEKDSFGFRIGG